MQLAGQNPEPDQKLPPSIYAALVYSLFQNPAPMFAGALCAAVAAIMTAVKTGNAWLWPCVALLVVTGAARGLDMHLYQRRKSSLTEHEASHWEIRYQIGAMLYAASLGIWCVVALLGSDDAVAHMITVSVTLGYMAAGAGRTYGRPWIFHLQTLLACGPLSVALLLNGNPYYIGLGLLNVLFFIGLKHITTSLQKIFVRALVAREREAALAAQFDTALNNMPHGLCMFGADGRLAVMNHRFSEMMRLSDNQLARGDAGATDIVAACLDAGTISAASGKLIVAEVDSLQAGYITTADPDQGRALSWTFQPMAGGGTVVLVEDITERRNAEARIMHLARYDELTALPNRVNFRDEMERLLAISHSAARLSALLFIDLDQFKQVNDTLGHPCGDELLCNVADRLREMLRPEDFVARFGGDEFVVFQQNIRSDEDAARLARRIVDRLSERYQIDNHLVEIGASIGIAMTTPPGISADTLMKNADMALYRAKADGRGTFCFFRDEMAQTVEAR
ncbi:MAG TPA: diguanylate cyclase, partial [Bradyrhizobium sp.]|nr:diguanylate cyclase [Bradyrhizobium sp.]